MTGDAVVVSILAGDQAVRKCGETGLL